VRVHGADLAFTEGAVREIARVALERATGMRSVVEEVMEGVLFEVEDGVRYVITEKTVRGGEAVKQSMSLPRAPLTSPTELRSPFVLGATL
jgi:ATP-dependent protease Clp ATPase subunit